MLSVECSFMHHAWLYGACPLTLCLRCIGCLRFYFTGGSVLKFGCKPVNGRRGFSLQRQSVVEIQPRNLIGPQEADGYKEFVDGAAEGVVFGEFEAADLDGL